MPYREPETVAILIAALLRRSGKTKRGRISEKTLKLIAKRKIYAAF